MNRPSSHSEGLRCVGSYVCCLASKPRYRASSVRARANASARVIGALFFGARRCLLRHVTGGVLAYLPSPAVFPVCMYILSTDNYVGLKRLKSSGVRVVPSASARADQPA